MIEAVIGWIKDGLTSSAERKRSARYAAIRIICILDEYAQKCVDVVFDDGTSEGRPAGRTQDGEEFYEPQAECPEPPIFPNDIDWKNISHKLLYRILTLPNAARETDRYIANSCEYSSPPDYSEVFEARHEGYASLGLEALELSSELRKEFGLPHKTLNTWNPEWDSAKFLKDKKAEIQKQRKKDATCSAEMFAEIKDINNDQ